MRKYPTDYRLWLLTTGVILAGIGVGILVYSPSLPKRLLLGGADRALAVAGELVVIGLVYLGIAAVVGWVIQGIAVACGFRLKPRRAPLESADYDDKPSDGFGRPDQVQ
jgi:hypothetical protein